MKIASGATVFNDAVGLRMSIIYSEVDPETGTVISDNKRIDRVVTDPEMKARAQAILADAQSFVDKLG